MALGLQERGDINFLFPVLLGDLSDDGVRLNFSAWSPKSPLPSPALDSAIARLLRREGPGAGTNGGWVPGRSMNEIMQAINSNQG